MSVDLVGSTAFKAMDKYEGSNGDDPSPGWVATFRTFYSEFHKFLKTAYEQEYTATMKAQPAVDEAGRHPAIWKTVGDEIIFCSTIMTVDHAAVTVSAFVRSLEDYAKKLSQDGLPLNVKGACWLAAFPAPNATIEVVTKSDKEPPADELGKAKSPEAIREERADKVPSDFDFLGKGIDTGFRIAKNAAEDRCVVSAQLAYLLAKATTKKRFHHPLGYHGREVLKGVVSGIPYPIISVDTERNERNWMLRSREAALRGERPIDAYALCDFLETFMQVASIEEPWLAFRGEEKTPNPPATYSAYVTSFEKNDKIDEQRLIDVATDDDASGLNEIPDGPQALLDKVAPEPVDSDDTDDADPISASEDQADAAE